MTDDKLEQDAQGLLAECMAAKRLNRPPQPHPEFLPASIIGLITLYEAFSSIGHHQFGEDWKGTEVDSVSQTEAEEMTARLNGEEKVELRKIVRSMLPEPNDEASKRRDIAWTTLREWLHAGTLPVYIFCDEHLRLIPMSPKKWGGEKDYLTFGRGRVALPDWLGQGAVLGGWLMVKLNELAEAAMFGEEASVPLRESAEPSVKEKQLTPETADAENEELTLPRNVPPDRKRDVFDDAHRKSRINSVLTEARQKWPNHEKAPSFRGMAKALVYRQPGHKFMEFRDTTIRKILEGRYDPAKRLGIGGLYDGYGG